MKIIICSTTQFINSIGIHSNQPDLWYAREAIKEAETKGFEKVFLHYKTIGTCNYKIPYDVLNELTLIAESELSTHVIYIHPAEPKEPY